MLVTEKPANFIPKQLVAGVLLVYGSKLLLCKRASHKKYGANKWALCAGTVEAGESFEFAAKRELFEETGIELDEKEFTHTRFFYHVGDKETGIEWKVFLVVLSEIPPVTLNDEHSEYCFVTPLEALTLDLMDGEETVIKTMLFS